MKFSSNAIKILAGLVLVALLVGYTSPEIKAQQKPDLKISALATPGGWSTGSGSGSYGNRLRVTVTNSQQVGTSDQIPVLVTISFSSGQPYSEVGYLPNGIGPNANAGLPVWFNNIYIPASGPANVVAVVNPDQEVLETVYNNNEKLKTVNVAGGGFAESGSSMKKANSLTVLVSGKKGQLRSRSSRSTGIAGATVLIKYKGKSEKLTTDRSGKATFKHIPAGYCEITVQKGKCKRKKKYKMLSKSSKYGFTLDCY